ncbi:Fic family protein [Lacticaseibacillus mingshuiensis]|uniref:Fic family protein n=1 Tax=Lacticaseibacillus mingshuiensis TaxID=2799574 RepID=UPI0019443955|nr:Fic family protein [Lacticaseibacillus mingshuiensis]
MEDKFKLTPEDEQLLFEKNLDGLIYSAGKFENLPTTRLDTKSIIENLAVEGVKPRDVEIILNMKHAFAYVQAVKAQTPASLAEIKRINQLVQGGTASDAGELRRRDVFIPLSGEDYVPAVPDVKEVAEQLNALAKRATSATALAIESMLYLSKHQLFSDGNKRTALIYANLIMYRNNCGIIAIPDTKMHWYLSLLTKYYLTGNRAVERWSYDNAVFGLTAGD